MASFIPVLLLIPALIVLMVSYHYYVPPHKRPWPLIAVVCASIYGAVIATNCYLPVSALGDERWKGALCA